MEKKPFILKDRELILKRPINLDEVPEPPKEDIPKIPIGNILKGTLWICIGLLIFSSLLVVVLVPSVRNAIADIIIPEEPEDERTYTPSTITDCKIIDGIKTCELSLFSGIRFIEEDKIWKPREKARSFKDSGIECAIKSDGVNLVECIDWNETSRTIKFSQKNTILTSVNVPLRKYTQKYNLTSDKNDRIYKKEFETTIDLDQETSYQTLEIKANPNEIIEYGEHSTIIELKDNTTENLEDTFTYEAQPTYNYGQNTRLDTDNCTAGNCNKETCIKFTLGSLPFNTEIINANLSLVTLQEGDKEIEVYELSNQSWMEGNETGHPRPEGYGINWNTKPTKGKQITPSVTVDTLHKRYFWNVTNWTKNQHDSGYSKVSYYFITSISEGDGTTGFYSAETSNTTVRPVLNITYQIVIPLVVNLQAPSNSSSGYTPYINFTYNVTDQDGGDIDNCSLYLKHYLGDSWELNKTDHNIEQIVNQTFNISLAFENVYWRVDCYADDSSHDVSPAWNYTRLIAYPNIDLQAPADGVNFTTRDVSFTYNISYNATIHYGSINECSLWLNGMLNKTDTSITTTINQTLNITLNNSHFYDWLVECKSDGGYKTNSSTYSFLFNNAPTIPTTLSPANETITVIDSAILSCSGSTDSESDTINYEFWNGTEKGALTLIQNSSLSTFNISMVRPDNYYWKCRANDNLSQSSFTSTRKVTYAQLYANCSTANSTSSIALNFTFADESNETRLYEIFFNSLFTFWGSDRTTNQTILLDESNREEVIYCISPKNGTLNTNAIATYEKTGWKLRYYTLQNYPIIGNSTNKTLYLLATADGLYVTFQVINLAGNPIDNVYFTAERRVDGTNWETIYSDLTDSAGTTTPFLDPDYPHKFTFSKSGYDTYTTTLTPTQTSYTIELGTGIEVTNETAYTRGVKYNILPVSITLTNNTEYNFTFNISSNYETLTSAGFTLTNSTGDTLATVSCTGDTGCMASTILDVGDNTFITMNYYWVISGTTSGGKKTWNVYTTYKGSYSIMTAFEDAEKLGSGFGDFAKSVISFLIIISIVGVATLKFNLHNYSESAVLFLIFALTGLLDYVGFLPSIPESIPHFIPILMGVISIGYFIYEMRR